MTIATTTRGSTTAAAVGEHQQSRVRAPHGSGAWNDRRHEVIDRAFGVCGLCGRRGADTAFRSWDPGDLIAAHTRCIVGLGSPSPC